MRAWLAVVLIGVGTFATRLSFIAALGRAKLPDWIPHALRYVPSAVLAALTIPAVVAPSGELALSLANERIGAAVVAGVIAWMTKNPAFTVVAGMATLWILEALG